MSNKSATLPLRILGLLTPSKHRGIFGYLLAFWLFCIGLLSRLLLAPINEGMPFITFIPAVTLAIFMGGTGPGLFAILVSTIIANYLFFLPYGEFNWTFPPLIVWSNLLFIGSELLIMAGVEAFYRDRKKLKKLSIQLKRDRKRLKLLADNIDNFASFMLDKNGIVTNWNEGSRKLLGYDNKEIIGQSHVRLYSPDDIKANLPATTLEFAKLNGIFEQRHWRVRKDGTRLYADIIISPLYDDKNDVSGYVKIYRDISSQRDYDERLHAIFQSIPVALLMVNAQHKIVQVNQATEQLFGYDTSELLDKPLDKLVPKRYHSKQKKYLAQYLLNAEKHANDIGKTLYGIRKTGEEFPVAVGFGSITLSGEHLIILSVNLQQLVQPEQATVPPIEIAATTTQQDSSISAAPSDDVPQLAPAELPVEKEVEISPELTALTPVFDIPATLARLYGNQGLLIKLLISFAANHADASSQIEQLLSGQQADKAAELLHRIRAAASNLGALALAEAAQKFKDEIRSASALADQANFAAQLDLAIQAIRRHIIPLQKIIEKPAVEPIDITNAIVTLSQLLNKHEVPNDAQIQNLIDMLSEHVPKTLLLAFEQHLLGFDFVAASLALRKINDAYHYNLTQSHS